VKLLCPIVLAGLLLQAALPLWAGTPVEPTEPAQAWQFKLAAPIWLAGAYGQTGIRGHHADVDVGVSQILSKLNFTASFSAEARNDRFGAYLDFLYLSDQTGVSRSKTISKIDFRADMYLTDFDLDWRIFRGSWGWVDVLAGARYLNVYSRLGLELDSDRVRTDSARLVDATAAQVQSYLKKALDGDLSHPPLPVPPLAVEQRGKLARAIRRAQVDPVLLAALRSGDPARIAEAKARVARNIAGILHNGLNRNFSLCEAWLDPYVGLRARYNLTSAFYLTAKGDVGGFGVGSKVSSQCYGAVGCQIARNFYAEAGYRWLYVDYDQNGFLYNMTSRGAELTLGVNF
jgi:hypothetical protein